MDLGLYNLKYPVRKMLSGVLPMVRHVDPNTISWCLVPIGLATAMAYFVAAQGRPGLYLVGIMLVFLRMFLGTLDGLVAVHYHRQTPLGDMVNRLAPELCDVMYLLTLTIARPEWMMPGVGALALAWMTSFAGLLGAVVGKPTQSVGPVGQTDRLAALQLFSLAAFLSARCRWGIDFIRIFLMWVIIGGILTVILRVQRHFRNVASSA